MSNFKIIAQDKSARAGVLKTAHGGVKTPVYMIIGTQGTVKALAPEDLTNIGVEMILGNTYHLYLRPGHKLIKKMGGLHKFMGWDGPILTDCGGFQAFSLGAMIEHGVRKVTAPAKTSPQPEVSVKRSSQHEQTRKVYSKITEEGVEFTSHLDGSKHLLSPELSMEVQLSLGSDVVLALDELISPLHGKEYVLNSLERTHRWEKRSLEHFKKNVKKGTNPGANIFGILQGVDDFEIRTNEAKWVASQEFAGVSIGGSFGTSPIWGTPEAITEQGDDYTSLNKMNTEWASSNSIDRTMGWVTPLLPADWARHALGIGEIVDLFACVQKGVDMFDCVAPTRRARNGSLYISPQNGGRPKNKFVIAISRAEYFEDKTPIDPGCQCYTCQNFSKSYLRHLFISGEILYHKLATVHNVYFVTNLMRQIREAIINKQFEKLRGKWLG